VIVLILVFNAGVSAQTTVVQRYSIYMVPGVETGFQNISEDIAKNLPDRLKNARLSVICRPSDKDSDTFSAALENALQKRFPAIRLLDRRNLDAVLSEQGRQMEDYANARTAPELQRVELAQAILFIDIKETIMFPELSSQLITATVVDVETAVKVWQSAPVKLLNIWIGYLIGILIVIIIVIIPFWLARRRSSRLNRGEILEDYNYKQLRPRLSAVQERSGTLRRELSKRKFTDEARELHELFINLEHLLDRAEILDTAISNSKRKDNSKILLKSLDSTAETIDKLEKLITEQTSKIRNNNIKGFDDNVNAMRAITDNLTSDFTHLEEIN